jgi:hypothetical protein
MYKLCYYRFGQVYTEQGTAGHHHPNDPPSRLAQLSSTGGLTLACVCFLAQLQASPKATIV